MAWANKLKKIRNVVVIFFGEGATEEGVFYESLNFAALHKLPVLFVCENNFYSVYSKLNKRQPSIRVIKDVAKSLGVKSSKINGNNIEDIFSQTAELIKKIKKNNSPYFIELDTYRFLEHCGPYNDDKLGYRSKKEIEYWLKRCPINTYQKKLIKDKIIDLNKIEKFKNKTFNQIETVFKLAQSDKFPNNNKLYKNIYAN